MQWSVITHPAGAATATVQDLFPNGADVLSPRFFPQAAGAYVLQISTTETPSRAGSSNSGITAATRTETVRITVACGQSPVVSIEADDDSSRVSSGAISAPLSEGPGDDDFDEAERGTGLTSAVWTLGSTVGLDARGTTDADTPASALTYSWSLNDSPSLPRVRRPGSSAMGFSRAAVLQTASATGVDAASGVQSSSTRGLAQFVPDGIGSYEVQAVASDGCSTPATGTFRVEVVCPAGPSAAATAVAPILLRPGLDALPSNVSLAGTASLGVSNPADAPSQFRQLSSAWTVETVPPGAPMPTPLPGSPPAVSVGSETTTFYAAGQSAWFVPTHVGTYVFRYHVTDGCSVAADDLIVTIAYTDSCGAGVSSTPSPSMAPSVTPSPGSSASSSPVAGSPAATQTATTPTASPAAASTGASPSPSSSAAAAAQSPAPSCPASTVVIVQDSTTAEVEFDTELAGLDSVAFSAS